jgi:hypothetical protein
MVVFLINYQCFVQVIAQFISCSVPIDPVWAGLGKWAAHRNFTNRGFSFSCELKETAAMPGGVPEV